MFGDRHVNDSSTVVREDDEHEEEFGRCPSADGVRLSTRQSANGNPTVQCFYQADKLISVQPRRQTAACVERREIPINSARHP